MPNPFDQGSQSGRATFNRVRDRLSGMFPAAFPSEGSERHPLALHIDADLVIQANMTRADARRFLEVWCNRPRYLAALVIKDFRIDLAGRPVSPVSDSHREHALILLEGRRSAGAAAARAAIRLHQIVSQKETAA